MMTSTMGNPFLQQRMEPGFSNGLKVGFNSGLQAGIRMASMYPLNHSLEEELNRLFADFTVSHVSSQEPKSNEIWEEFRHNGKDYEHCPDSPDPTERKNILRSCKKKSKKPLPTECVFCKNNGEDASVYKYHLLKDLEGRILCPILRAYTCPLCKATKDNAHTFKYCPLNDKPLPMAPMNTIKTMRNSTGRRRSK